ncbi:hypothetical protein EYF80_025450 [Liparis tanakae]|uniref:Uncharacterized protein n=1 Tax=Liparis tanakae TaxID=230148 RepID=A0A4Z2HFL6_9TELE|nr:hypothetical protein EYF80_025450 [Liparis tanakae]
MRLKVAASLSLLQVLTRVLKELAGDGDPPPLASGDPGENTASNNTVGHVTQTQLGHHPRHLHRGQRSREIFLTLRQQEGSDGSSPASPHSSLFPSDTNLKDSFPLLPLSGSTDCIE